MELLIIVVLAGAGLLFASWLRNKETDSPKPIYFKMPAPRLYATVKKVLFKFRLMEYHFQIVEADSTTLSLRAVCEWRDRTFRTMPVIVPEGYVFGQVILDVQVGTEPQRGCAYIQLAWRVLDGPFRAKGNLIQATLLRALNDALEQAQQSNYTNTEIWK